MKTKIKKPIETQVINGVTWTNEFPKKVGEYWFYGYRYGKVQSLRNNTFNDPEFMIVKVHKISNGMMQVADGQFMYESEVEEAWFTPLTLPEFPKLNP